MRFVIADEVVYCSVHLFSCVRLHSPVIVIKFHAQTSRPKSKSNTIICAENSSVIGLGVVGDRLVKLTAILDEVKWSSQEIGYYFGLRLPNFRSLSPLRGDATATDVEQKCECCDNC